MMKERIKLTKDEVIEKWKRSDQLLCEALLVMKYGMPVWGLVEKINDYLTGDDKDESK